MPATANMETPPKIINGKANANNIAVAANLAITKIEGFTQSLVGYLLYLPELNILSINQIVPAIANIDGNPSNKRGETIPSPTAINPNVPIIKTVGKTQFIGGYLSYLPASKI